MAFNNYGSNQPSYGAHSQWSHVTPPMDEYQSYNFSPLPPTLANTIREMVSECVNQHKQAQPLAIQPISQPIWPSMLTGGPTQPPPSYEMPILPAAPVHTVSTATNPTSASAAEAISSPRNTAKDENFHTQITPAAQAQTPVPAVSTALEATPTNVTRVPYTRRKLTLDERRNMCIEAAMNPDMKQTQIGLKFGVERSTVSKILRQKEKYMNLPSREGCSSPAKKSKSKFPDIERAVINWLRNEERKGEVISDDTLKNLLGTKNKGKSNSKDFSQVTAADSSTTSYTDGHLYQSLVSSASGLLSPPPSLEEDNLQQDVNKQGNDEFFDFGNRDVTNLMSLDEVVSPDLESGVTVLSPLTSYQQRPSSVSVTTPGLEDNSPAYASAYSRQQSQAFPGRRMPFPERPMTTSTPPQDLHVNPREVMKRMPSMEPPPLPKSEPNFPVSSGLPTEEEARQALHTLKSFFQAQSSDTLGLDDCTSISRNLKRLCPGDDTLSAAMGVDKHSDNGDLGYGNQMSVCTNSLTLSGLDFQEAYGHHYMLTDE